MKIHDLQPPPGSRKARKRVGRGHGSGHGKTAGRGTKGTKARGSVSPFFEGGQMPITRRVPKLKGFTPPHPKIYDVVNVGDLGGIDAPEIGPDELRGAGLLARNARLVKILGSGEVTGALVVRAHAFSKSAREKLEGAGGRAEILDEKARTQA